MAAAAVLCAAGAAASAQQIAEVRQGTNIAAAAAPDGGPVVVDLLGQLWSLPVTGGAAQPLTPEREQARNPRFSPDGRRVVYQRLLNGQWDLWLLDVDTRERRALTETPNDEREPDFIRSGDGVVFASNRTGHFCLWRLDIATGVLTQLTEEPGDASFPAVSDHDQIAYALARDGRSELRVLTEQGVSVELVATDHSLAAPSWRPGGDVLLFNELGVDEVAGARSSQLKMLVLGDLPVIKPLTRAEDVFRARAAWLSPAEFIYTADGQIWRRGLAALGRQPVHLFAAVAVEAASPPRVEQPLDGPAAHPVRGIAGLNVAADGRTAVFTALGDLWIAERAKARRLTDDPFVESDPVLTPDGRFVIFASDRGGNMHLWRIGADGTAPLQLTSGPGKRYRPSLAADGRTLSFLATDGLGPWAPTTARTATLMADGTFHEEPAPSFRAALGPSRIDPAAGGAELGASGVPPPAAEGRAELEQELREAVHLEWTAEPAGEPYVVQVGRLFDGVRADYRRHVDIHVEQHRITAIVGRNLKPLPAKVIDARDATVIPGLIDVHAHQSALAGERLGRAWLAYGVTTVREIAEDLPAALERGEAWASGRRRGPRLVVSPGSTQGAPPASLSPVVVQSFADLSNGLGHRLWRQARDLGVPVAPQGLPAVLARDAAVASPYALELSPLHSSYQDSMGRIVASGTVVVPALAALYGLEGSRPRSFEDPAFTQLFSPDERAQWSGARLAESTLAALQDTVARLLRNGGRVAIGSDAPAAPYGLGVHRDMQLLAAAGIPNDLVLRIATAQGALALGLEQQLGTLEEGKLADFVVLDGDPLARIEDTLTVTAVAKGGRWFDRAELLATP